MQAAWVVTVQVPFVVQQAPGGWTQGFGEQTPNMVQVAVQSARSVTVHVPSGAQHDPGGWTQGFGSHEALSPW